MLLWLFYGNVGSGTHVSDVKFRCVLFFGVSYELYTGNKLYSFTSEHRE